MAQTSEDSDKSEAATAFKLNRARRQGSLARGTDLGFFAVLLALAIAAQLAGPDVVSGLAAAMRRSLAGSGAIGANGLAAIARGWADALAVAAALLLPALLMMVIAATAEILQNRGLIFSTEPLKLNFSRLDPAKGIKRLFSLRLLKELGKNLVKLALYGMAAWLFIADILNDAGLRARDGRQLAQLLVESAGRLLLLFLFLAAAIAVLDQLLARGEFARSMRMSRREVSRELREREGEPRQKQQRRQILAEIIKQAAAAANLKGADMVIVNPTHLAVALRYRADESDAPILQARGRNLWAQRMRRAAQREGIVIIQNPALARALFHDGQIGQAIGRAHFVAVADLYLALRRAAANSAVSPEDQG